MVHYTRITISSLVGKRVRSIHTLVPTKLLTLMHVKHNISCLFIQPSSCRWTLRFETYRRYQNL